MKIGLDFNDITSYISNMNKGMEDKLFFLDRIIDKNKNKSYFFVDFGCADGTMIAIMYDMLKDKGVNAYYVGYDISEEMITLAKTKFNEQTANVTFTTDWEEVKKLMRLHSDCDSVLILSSVVHEVYSYARADHDDIGDFWRKVKNSGFKYVCVRDMMCSSDINRLPNMDILVSVTEKNCRFEQLKRQQKDFDGLWVPIARNNKSLVHFLLKYRWTINWERELHEDYFPIYIDEFLSRFKDTYNISYFERFRVPYLDKCIKEDFGVELEDYTHVKIVFELKK